MMLEIYCSFSVNKWQWKLVKLVRNAAAFRPASSAPEQCYDQDTVQATAASVASRCAPLCCTVQHCSSQAESRAYQPALLQHLLQIRPLHWGTVLRRSESGDD